MLVDTSTSENRLNFPVVRLAGARRGGCDTGELEATPVRATDGLTSQSSVSGNWRSYLSSSRGACTERKDRPCIGTAAKNRKSC